MVKGGRTPGPFFVFPDGKLLTKGKFVGFLKDTLGELGLPKEQFAGHSLRIGAATAAAQAGIEDSIVMMLGHWNSAAFLRYTRTPKAVLAAAMARLSRGPRE